MQWGLNVFLFFFLNNVPKINIQEVDFLTILKNNKNWPKFSFGMLCYSRFGCRTPQDLDVHEATCNLDLRK